MSEKNITIKILSAEEQPKTLPLLGRCFTEYWEVIANTMTTFPHDCISFAAIDENGDIIGHVGITDYIISDGKGGSMKMAGIASVAVAPEARGLNIATKLCCAARDWAQENGYASLPLYTGLDRVYGKSGWVNYVSGTNRKLKSNGASCPICLKPARELSDQEKQTIIALYEGGEDFFGKYVRGNATSYFDWTRLFKEENYTFALSDGIYGLLMDGNLVELCWRSDLPLKAVGECVNAIAAAADNQELHMSLPDTSAVWSALSECGYAVELSTKDLMHGEHPMYFDLVQPGPHSMVPSLFYPLAEKF